MILFHWVKDVHETRSVPVVEKVVGARIWVNIDLAARWSIGFGKMQFTLDCLGLWGGADKIEKCVDGTTTLSWEIPGDRFELVQTIVEKWKTPPSGMPAWIEQSFFFDAAKEVKTNIERHPK